MWVAHNVADCKGSAKNDNKRAVSTNTSTANPRTLSDAKTVLTAAVNQMNLPTGRDPQDCVEAILAILNAA